MNVLKHEGAVPPRARERLREVDPALEEVGRHDWSCPTPSVASEVSQVW